jgi:hypothetical protein
MAGIVPGMKSPLFPLFVLTVLAILGSAVASRAEDAPTAAGFRMATFSADITVPMGHGMMGGSWLSKSVADPLWAHGVVLLGGPREFPPVVYVVLDWCEIRNEALDRWKAALAEAAGTVPERVMVSTVHQHDAPVADLDAERILRAHGAKGTVCDLDFHEVAVKRAATALREALPGAKPVTHIGTGQAKVEQVASNRRYTTPDGTVHFNRMSRSVSAVARAADDGVIDPWLKTLSFWNGDTAIAAISVYSVHPMSYYGSGEVSADFPGMARAKRQEETPGVKQIYASGCAGNVTAGKYNDGARATRPVLAGRIHAAMKAAWEATHRRPLGQVAFRNGSVRLEPRDGPGWTVADLEKKLSAEKPFEQCLAAMALSWRKRADAGQRIDIPVLDLGAAQLIVVPGEAYVEYQLFAQQCRPDSFVVAAGYGEGATGYIPTERHIEERDGNLSDWWWVAPGSEPRLKEAIKSALAK